MGEILRYTLYDCKRLGITGIIGFECASGYWGMSSYDYISFPIFVYRTPENEVERKVSNISYIGIPDKISYEHTINLGTINNSLEGIYVTDKERTLCDMIQYESDLFHLLESIDAYYTYEKRVDKLEEMAKSRGIYSKLIELKGMAEDEIADY